MMAKAATRLVMKRLAIFPGIAISRLVSICDRCENIVRTEGTERRMRVHSKTAANPALAVMRLLACLIVLLAGAGSARAEERIALVVGNSSYSTVGSLENAVNDARLIAATLQELGFEVTYLSDVSQMDLKRGIAAFGRALRQAGPQATGLFYYAGHGVQSFGTNYLLPVDTELTDAADLPLVAVEAETVLRQMHSARNRTNIVILDACRNNPFEKVLSFTDNGLAEMNAPTGTFLAYATAPGAVAFDGQNGNSPFTRALAQTMRSPGVPVEQVFKQVRVSVLEETGGLQTPWDTSSLTTDFSFVAAVAQAPAPPRDPEQDLWESVKQARDPVQIALFLRGYPDSRFAAAAQALLVEVAAGGEQARPASPTQPVAPAPVAPEVAENDLIERAQTEGTIEAYQAYLDAFPTGVFADLARLEIAALDTDSSTDPVGDGVTPEAPEAPAPTASAPATPDQLTFNSPLVDPDGPAHGRTLAELITGSPAFPPFEGLPDELWKGQDCSSCHQWDQAKLCEQAMTYNTRGADVFARIPHPFGGGFKRAMATWASGGCR